MDGAVFTWLPELDVDAESVVSANQAHRRNGVCREPGDGAGSGRETRPGVSGERGCLVTCKDCEEPVAAKHYADGNFKNRSGE